MSTFARPIQRAASVDLTEADADLARTIDAFGAVSLGELDGVALLNRTDTKFLLTVSRLAPTLAHLTGAYRVLEIAGTRWHRYRTVYFDTPRLDLYHLHHTDRAIRYKVRSRSYLDSGLAFVEVKRRTSAGRTVKHRLPTPRLLTRLTPEASAFVASHAPLDPQALRPALANDFVRITLVNSALTERVTVDVGVRFSADDCPTTILPGIAIVEVKQRGVDRASDVIRQLRGAHVQPISVSKYCTGVALLRPAVKHNAFNPKLRTLRKLMACHPLER